MGNTVGGNRLWLIFAVCVEINAMVYYYTIWFGVQNAGPFHEWRSKRLFITARFVLCQRKKNTCIFKYHIHTHNMWNIHRIFTTFVSHLSGALNSMPSHRINTAEENGTAERQIVSQRLHYIVYNLVFLTVIHLIVSRSRNQSKVARAKDEKPLQSMKFLYVCKIIGTVFLPLSDLALIIEFEKNDANSTAVALKSVISQVWRCEPEGKEEAKTILPGGNQVTFLATLLCLQYIQLHRTNGHFQCTAFTSMLHVGM